MMKPDELQAEDPGEGDLCLIYNSACIGDKCPGFAYIPEGDKCPIGLDAEALDAVKEAMAEAARYIDRHLGVEKGSGKDLLTQVREAIRDGKIEWAGIMEDLAKLDL